MTVNLKTRGLILAGISLCLLTTFDHSAVAASRAAPRPAAPPAPDFSSVQVHSVHVQGNVYMLVGAGGNVTVQIGEDGVLVIDTQFAPMAEKLLAEIRRLAGDKPIRWVLLTHGHPDHIGGNAIIRAAGHALEGGDILRVESLRGEQAGITSLAHENVQQHLVKAKGTPQEVKEADWPTETYIGDGYQFYFNDEAIDLIHPPTAHTDGDTMIYFRRSDVLVTGDIYGTETYPFIDKSQGGSFQGLLDALTRIIDITVPKDKEEGGTMVIPGHGRLSDEADVVENRDMLTAIKTRIKAMIAQGMSLEQVKAARPTEDYDPRYGANLPFWTTDMFIQVVYEELKAAAANRTAG